MHHPTGHPPSLLCGRDLRILIHSNVKNDANSLPPAWLELRDDFAVASCLAQRAFTDARSASTPLNPRTQFALAILILLTLLTDGEVVAGVESVARPELLVNLRRTPVSIVHAGDLVSGHVVLDLAKSEEPAPVVVACVVHEVLHGQCAFLDRSHKPSFGVHSIVTREGRCKIPHFVSRLREIHPSACRFKNLDINSLPRGIYITREGFVVA
mmetsp:Transcript_62397/g.147091  ORF Transcript_62397/g.147091 Transcript_62397/m.147091 type:complete len:212 (-) Transcript_62397:518-1153(-)